MSAPCVAPCATPRSRPSGRETAPGTCAAGRSVQTATRSNRSGPATPARPCAAGRPPCVATRSCCACSTRRRLAKGVFPAAPLPPGRKARPSTHAGTSFVCSAPAFSLFRQVSSCHFSEPARERESTSAPRSCSARACAASVPSPRGHTPVRTATASRAARTPAPPWGATRARPPPRPASGLPQNPRRASTCARR